MRRRSSNNNQVEAVASFLLDTGYVPDEKPYSGNRV
jgi:hypothetical protein